MIFITMYYFLSYGQKFRIILLENNITYKTIKPFECNIYFVRNVRKLLSYCSPKELNVYLASAT